MYVHRTIYVAGGSQRVLGGTACGYAVEAKQGCPRFNRFDFVTNCQLRSIDSIDSYIYIMIYVCINMHMCTHISMYTYSIRSIRLRVGFDRFSIFVTSWTALRRHLEFQPTKSQSKWFLMLSGNMSTQSLSTLKAVLYVYIFDIIYYILHISWIAYYNEYV